MSLIQSILHGVEVGEGRPLARLIPLLAALVVIVLIYDVMLYHGLNDAQSMDNAQLARQIQRGDGFTTMFIRPYAITQLRNYQVSRQIMNDAPVDLFPADKYPPGRPRTLPDTYNAPGYPVVLAGWFKLFHPKFQQTFSEITEHHAFTPERIIPGLNQIFMVLTALLLFFMGMRLFDDRVGWLASVSFLSCDLVWQYSITALPTNMLMFLVTALLFCLLEIFRIGEICFESEEGEFWPVWLWAFVAALLLALICLTRLPLLVLLPPVMLFLILMPRANMLVFPMIALVVIVLVGPWFLRNYQVSGSPVGSNMPLLLYGEENFAGNEIYCMSSIPNYERLFKDVSKKQYLGFRYHFDHVWELLGSNPMIMLYGVALLHRFRRLRAHAFVWLLAGSAACIVAANNLCNAHPEPMGAWNSVIVVFPGMLIVGSAFFLVMLDRLSLPLQLLNNAIVVLILALGAMPLAVSLTSGSDRYYNYPPYVPSYIIAISNLAAPEEWVTSDMPWATAWYADHASLWLPDSVHDFDSLHDDVCPTGILLLTPVTLQAPLMNLTSGEYKDWLPFFTGVNVPQNFPLSGHSAMPPGGPEYTVWANPSKFPNH